jgi:hypothetical protein
MGASVILRLPLFNSKRGYEPPSAAVNATRLGAPLVEIAEGVRGGGHRHLVMSKHALSWRLNRDRELMLTQTL